MCDWPQSIDVYFSIIYYYLFLSNKKTIFLLNLNNLACYLKHCIFKRFLLQFVFPLSFIYKCVWLIHLSIHFHIFILFHIVYILILSISETKLQKIRSESTKSQATTKRDKNIQRNQLKLTEPKRRTNEKLNIIYIKLYQISFYDNLVF